MKKLDPQQVYEHLDRQVEAAVEQLGPDAHLRVRRRLKQDEAKGSFGGERPTGKVWVETKYIIEGIPADRNRQAMDVLFDYLTTYGYRVVRDQRDRSSVPGFRVANKAERCGIGLMENMRHELRISSGSHPFVPVEMDDRPESR